MKTNLGGKEATLTASSRDPQKCQGRWRRLDESYHSSMDGVGLNRQVIELLSNADKHGFLDTPSTIMSTRALLESYSGYREEKRTSSRASTF
jgi:two-component sensor histidine kinase